MSKRIFERTRTIPIVALLATGCVTAIDEPGDPTAESETTQELNGSVTYQNCTAAEQSKLTSALQAAVGTMASSTFHDCMANAWMVETHGYLVEDMIARVRAMPTTITCVAEGACGANAAACTGVGSYTGGPNNEPMSIVKSTIANYSVSSLAGVIAHEASHAQGWNHPGNAGAMAYPFSVPEQFNSCTNLGDANGFTRADTRFESELAKIGGEGGEIYNVWCPSGTHATGISAQADATAVRGFQLQCSNGTWTGYIGGTGGATVTRACPSGQSLAGFNGRSGSFVTALSAGCEVDTNIVATAPTTFASWTWLGGAVAGGTAIERACPAGKAIVGAVGRAGGYLDSVRWICRDLDAPAVQNPHVVGRLGAADASTMMAHDQLCSGGGALIGLMGQAGAEVDQLNAMCLPRARGLGPNGVVVLDSDTLANRHALEYGGGIGGLPYEEKCASGSAIVGLRAQSGARIDAIGAVCAPTTSWGAGTTTTTNLPLQGGTTGNYNVLMCPPTEFVVGLETWWKDTPELTGDPVTVHATSPICRRLK